MSIKPHKTPGQWTMSSLCILKSLTYIDTGCSESKFFSSFSSISCLIYRQHVVLCTAPDIRVEEVADMLTVQCHNVSPRVCPCASLLCLGPGSGIVRGSLNYLWYISLAKISCIRGSLEIPLISLPRMRFAAPRAGGGRVRPAMSPPRTGWHGTRLKRSFQITN